MQPRPSTPQSSCMMQLPHAYSLQFGKCSTCGQDRAVRQVSNKKKDRTICISCFQCTEGGYWPAGQCSGPCCTRLRAHAGIRT
eukprot:1541900-Heterocapsa_arctica.AAC.1